MNNGSNQYGALTWLWIWIWWPEVHLLCLENENSALAPSHFLLPSTAPGLVVTKQIGREEGTACEKLWTWRTDHKLQPDGHFCLERLSGLCSDESKHHDPHPTKFVNRHCIHYGEVVVGINFFPEREKCLTLESEFIGHGYGSREKFWNRGISRHNWDTGKTCSRVFVSLLGTCISDSGMLGGWSSWLLYCARLVLVIWSLLSIISLRSAGCSDKIVLKG